MERPPRPDLNDSGNDREPVPRLPRGSGVHLSGQTIFRILMFAVLLVGVIMLREPCASSVATFMGQFDGDAGTGDADSPGQADQSAGQGGDRLPPGSYVRITGDMTEQELEQALRQAGVAIGDAAIDDAGTADAGAVPAVTE